DAAEDLPDGEPDGPGRVLLPPVQVGAGEDEQEAENGTEHDPDDEAADAAEVRPEVRHVLAEERHVVAEHYTAEQAAQAAEDAARDRTEEGHQQGRHDVEPGDDERDDRATRVPAEPGRDPGDDRRVTQWTATVNAFQPAHLAGHDVRRPDRLLRLRSRLRVLLLTAARLEARVRRRDATALRRAVLLLLPRWCRRLAPRRNRCSPARRRCLPG